MATDKTPAEPEPSPTHAPEPPQKTLEQVVYLLADHNKPPTPFCYEDYPEWKRWALAGGLEEFARLHNVQVSFLLYSMPDELYEAYVDTTMQNQDLRNAIDALKQKRIEWSHRYAASNCAEAIAEGWDEEASESEEESLCLPEVVSYKTQPEHQPVPANVCAFDSGDGN